MNNNTTIGMDLGNAKHTVCALDADGNILFRKEIANTPEALKPFFEENAGATVAMETGLCCRWISALAKGCGCDAIVGNARKLAAIWASKNKNDANDALLIAKIARADRELFHPVTLRDDEHHELLQIIGLRDIAISERTKAVNAIRGMCKARAVFLPKCDANCFLKAATAGIPDSLMPLFRPMLALLKTAEGVVKRYDKMLERYSGIHFGEDVRILKTAPCVGPITSAAFVACVGDAGRFGKARDIGPFLGLTPGQDQSGASDAPKRITKAGNATLRHLLVNCATRIMQANSPDCALKRHGQRICARGGKVAKKKARVAVARKLAVLMLAMLKSRKEYDDSMPVADKRKDGGAA